MLHIFLAALVEACQRTIAIKGIHHRLALRIDDTAGQACRHRHAKEGAVDCIAPRQAKGNVGHTHYSVNPPSLHSSDNLTGNLGVFGTSRNSHSQRVDYDIAAFDAILSSAGDNFIGNSNASRSRLRNPVIIQAQSYTDCAIFFGQRQHVRQAVLLAVDRIKHRLAVIQAQRTLHGLIIRRINLQRRIGNGLQRRHCLSRHSRLINTRCADIDIQNVRACAYLLQAQAADVIQVTINQRFLQALFACGINALANNYRPLADMHCPAIGRNRCKRAVAAAAWLHALALSNHFGNVLRRSAAAAAHNARSLACQLVHQLSIFVRANVKAGFAVTLHREAGVRIDDNRQTHRAQHLRQQTSHLHGTQAAVKADGINAQALAHQCCSLHRRTSQQLAVLVKGHRYANGQVTVFLGRQNCCLNLIGVAHGFNQNQISTSSSTIAHHFAVGLHCLFKGKVAIGS